MAKFGIALEWGSRGHELESRHSDQEKFRFPRKAELFIAFLGQKVERILCTKFYCGVSVELRVECIHEAREITNIIYTLFAQSR